MDTLDQPSVRAVLDREHQAAQAQRTARAAASSAPAPRVRRDFREAEFFQHRYLAVGPGEGALLYMLARTAGARNIVEFGSSFGISTLYLAAAAEENDGRVIGSEYYENKRDHALSNLEDAGLAHRVEIRLGDALETLADVPDAVDLVFLDGDKSLYWPVLELLRPQLIDGAVIVADNLDHFDDDPENFRSRILAQPERYTSRVVRLGKGEISISRYRRD
ncbi:hypothetical protein BGP77_12265 [Saccharospirillum sp. MSK14-1]|uniref:O-methyltransferase n=1 Tax=Saccharospirillum sp. MSK14-1 TaxID=1897632 RepID=UPI000D3B7066|nr:class I SAM-dependent methyltransferase [Saccharospirillum sp. MSK14-1]PTY38476.1 hypothetical protein BGP77_12265 [Saccharospirillum sp. MSK14-1]